MKKVLIICQCATNKGDRAIAEYLIGRLNDLNVDVTLSTTEPELWQGVNAMVIGTGYKPLFKSKNRFLRKVSNEFSSRYYKKFVYPELLKDDADKRLCSKLSGKFIEQIKSADTVIVTGGHHITSMRNENALFAITYDIGLASIYGKEYFLWSQTIGPLVFTDNDAKSFFARVIKNAQAVFIRDKNSEGCLKDLIGENLGNIKKSYDSVFGFGNMTFKEYSQREKKVGVAIFNGLKKAFKTFEILAQMLDYYALMGYEIEFFRMEYDNKEESDINSVISMMREKAKITIFPFASSTVEHLHEVASCKFFIGYKTHSIIMALTAGTPLISIAYHQKSIDFMKDYNLEHYAISDEDLTFESAKTLIQQLSENADDIHRTQREVSYTLAEKIQNDFVQGISLC